LIRRRTMRSAWTFGKRALLCCAPLTFALWSEPARAQVTEVVVGVTPTCIYGMNACWGGAYQALGRLDDVETVERTPDAYNCTAHLFLKDKALPDIDQWAEQFRSIVGQSYVFRGVEVTVVGSIEGREDGLNLQVPGLKQPVTLAPLQHKLQWNFAKASARQPEPDEQAAYAQFADKSKATMPGPVKVQVTGPLRKTDTGVVLEVREFFLLMRGADPYGRY
jgi:hypothetical protein